MSGHVKKNLKDPKNTSDPRGLIKQHKTRKSLTALDYIAFVTLIMINFLSLKIVCSYLFTCDHFIQFLYLETTVRYLKNLKGHSTSGKMNVYLKWVIYVEEM